MEWKHLHLYYDDEFLKQDTEVLKIVEHSRMVDSNKVSKLFKKIQEKGDNLLMENINNNNEIKSDEEMEI